MSRSDVTMKLPITHTCGLLNHLNIFHRGMLELNAKFDADLLFSSLSHFECDSHTVHMLTHWHLLPPLTSTVKSSLFIHAHSSPLSLAASYIDVVQTILILTMAGLFPDRPHMSFQTKEKEVRDWNFKEK